MSKERKKGTAFETAVATYLTLATGKEVTRNPLHGAKDKGDLRGLEVGGEKCTVECKNTKKLELSTYLKELENEMANDMSDLGIVVWKRPGIGIDNPIKTGDHAVIMTLSTFAEILAMFRE